MRNVQIDILRCLAATLVLIRHAPDYPTDQEGILASIMVAMQRGGWIGVDLFFVLSGFLVSGLLFREAQQSGRVDAWRFLIRRGFKIYPIFWLLMIVTVPGRWKLGLDVPAAGLAGELLFLQNYVGHLWHHTWSLAVEEHFYLLIVVVIASTQRFTTGSSKFEWVPFGFVVLAFACLAWRLWRAETTPFTHDGSVFPTHLRIDSLFFGTFLAYLWHCKGLADSSWSRLRIAASFSLGIACLLPAFFYEDDIWWIYTWGFTLFYLGSGALLLGAMKLPLQRPGPISRVLAKIGMYSYSIYVWHFLVALWLVPFVNARLDLQLGWWSFFAVYLVSAVLLGACIAVAVELPLLRYRDRRFPSRSKAPYGKA